MGCKKVNSGIPICNDADRVDSKELLGREGDPVKLGKMSLAPVAGQMGGRCLSSIS